MPHIIFIMVGFIAGYLFARMASHPGIRNVENDMGLPVSNPHTDTEVTSNISALPGAREVNGVAVAGIFSGHLAPVRWEGGGIRAQSASSKKSATTSVKKATKKSNKTAKTRSSSSKKKSSGGKKSVIQRQRDEKQARIEKALQHFYSNEKVTNDDVQALLGVSDATATRYLSELEKTGHITQVGGAGRKVHYEKVK